MSKYTLVINHKHSGNGQTPVPQFPINNDVGCEVFMVIVFGLLFALNICIVELLVSICMSGVTGAPNLNDILYLSTYTYTYAPLIFYTVDILMAGLWGVLFYRIRTNDIVR